MSISDPGRHRMMGMTATVFTRPLRRRLAMALGDNGWLSHSALDSLWMEFGDGTSLNNGTKADKANEMVQKISEKPHADNDFLEIINDAFFLDAKAGQRQDDLPFSRLQKALQDEGFGLTEDGFTFPIASEIDIHPPMAPRPAPTSQTHTQVWESHVDLDSPPSWAMTPTLDTTAQKAKTNVTSVPPIRDDRSVFIVHGRDLDNRNALENLLRRMDIRPVTWTDAAKHAPTQETLKIVETGMAIAQAVIVLFTPDDQAMLKEQFQQPNDDTNERRPTGQARPNVILEAGMAYAKAPARTIFARIGHLRPISDIDGINWITLNNDWDSRLRLRNDLLKAGVSLDQDANLIDESAGKFRTDD